MTRILRASALNPGQICYWRECNIDIRQFSNEGVKLIAVKKIILGIGNRNATQSGSDGTMYFDDIRVYPARCIATLLQPTADFDGNCVVNFADLKIMAGAWLDSGALLTSDLDGNGDVDLGDFSTLAENWLDELLWPQP